MFQNVKKKIQIETFKKNSNRNKNKKKLNHILF
jgi:hypothetical protein